MHLEFQENTFNFVYVFSRLLRYGTKEQAPDRKQFFGKIPEIAKI